MVNCIPQLNYMARGLINVNHLLQASSGFLITRPKSSSSTSSLRPLSISCTISTHPGEGVTIERRSANYQSSVWDFDFIQSLKNDYKGSKKHESEAKKLEDRVRNSLKDEKMTELAQLELIDVLQRMGLEHKFEKEIKMILEKTATRYENSIDQTGTNEHLHAVALRFRLLRQHGHLISSQEAFNIFKDGNGNFKESLCEDVEGMLSLYEASYYALETGDDILDEAKCFTTRHLKDMEGQISNPKLAKLVSHAMELPLHWRLLPIEVMWYIKTCSEEEDNINLIRLAKLNFNMIQAIYQEELKELSRWWKTLGLVSYPQLRFARDRLAECFLWAAGIVVHPQESYSRKNIAKFCQLVTVIDDMYDVYGSLDELERFTDAIERWDINAMDQLPKYMKICLLAVFNYVNEMVCDTLMEKDVDILHYLKKAWANLCKAYLMEAKWFYNKYTPTLKEYLDNAWISVTGPVLMMHTYCTLNHEIRVEELESIQEHSDIVRWASMLFRLLDDYGTAKDEIKRGDVPKSIQCYMQENGASEEAAIEHIKQLIGVYWKKLNKELTDRNSLFSDAFVRSTADVNRTAHRFYLYGLDGYGVSHGTTKDAIFSLVVEPMSLGE